MEKFTSPPLLQHFNKDIPVEIESNILSFATGAVLNQYKRKMKHPIVFYSKAITLAKKSYDIYDKEILTIVQAFSKCCIWQEGHQHLSTGFSNHQSLEFFDNTTRQLYGT
jgi:hypothetical protein